MRGHPKKSALRSGLCSGVQVLSRVPIRDRCYTVNDEELETRQASSSTSWEIATSRFYESLVRFRTLLSSGVRQEAGRVPSSQVRRYSDVETFFTKGGSGSRGLGILSEGCFGLNSIRLASQGRQNTSEALNIKHLLRTSKATKILDP